MQNRNCGKLAIRARLSARILCAASVLFCAAAITASKAQADAVYYASFGGTTQDIGVYPLIPMAWGSYFSGTSADAHDLTVAGSHVYWEEGNNIYQANIDGSSKILLQSFGIAPTSLAVDETLGTYFASFGGATQDIGAYPISPMAWGSYFAGTGTSAHDLTVAGNQLFWVEGENIWEENVDGTGKTLLQTFGIDPVSLAVDAASGMYYASFGGTTNDIGVYPISPMAWGSYFTGTGTGAHDLTIAGDQLFWLEGDNVWEQNLDGSDKTLLQTFGIAPTSLAVFIPAPDPVDPNEPGTAMGVPEPISLSLLGAGVLGVSRLRRRRNGRA
jgi:hypothetical protein